MADDVEQLLWYEAVLVVRVRLGEHDSVESAQQACYSTSDWESWSLEELQSLSGTSSRPGPLAG